MSYTSVFGGNTIYPSDVSYLSIALTADTPLEWPLESSGTEDPAARIIDVDPSASGFSVVLPDATLTGAGQTILFNNIDVTYSFYVKDYAGNTLATVAAGTQWQVYLAATTTPAGTWRVFRYGASTATVQPSALAGFGLTVTDSTLSQSLPVTTFSTTGITVATSNRASAFVWDATGSGTLNLLTAASAGNNFFVFVRNEGGGDLTVEPSGSETINSGPNLALRPGDSATLITDGTEWFTIGLGQQAVFAFDYTSISITGGNYTLAGSELNRIAYKFVGTLASDAYIIVPPTIQQYWINNATSGAFSLFVQTSGGTPVEVNQGAKGIYYCDGTNLVLASDPTTLTTPLVVADGGTGATTASGARLSLGISTFADAIVTATTGASVRTTITAAKSGANSDITSLTGLTTPLSVAQGGTGSTTAADARTALSVPSTTGSDASGTWSISVSGSAASATTATTANALNTGNSYTVAGLDSSAPIYATTPNSGTSGGFVLRGNATSGNAIIQVRDSTSVSQWGYAVVTSAGGFAWSGSMTATSFSGAGTGLTGTASGLSIGGNAATATSATSATSATNAANLVTANYSIVQASGYIYIKYGSTNICRIDSSGNAVFAGNVTAYGSI